MDAVARMWNLAHHVAHEALLAAHGGDGGSYCDRVECRRCDAWRSLMRRWAAADRSRQEGDQ